MSNFVLLQITPYDVTKIVLSPEQVIFVSEFSEEPEILITPSLRNYIKLFKAMSGISAFLMFLDLKSCLEFIFFVSKARYLY